ncbi:MAG: LPXTG cell wall anchor domain-containing protein [Bifidobacteriaceae bacterium]|nr:LPXTG cell wall anchor domain-containing protein [Bifidobacteriaceae bacterium]
MRHYSTNISANDSEPSFVTASSEALPNTGVNTLPLVVVLVLMLMLGGGMRVRTRKRS